MDAEHRHRLGKAALVRGDHTPITKPAEILGREKAETARVPQDSGSLPMLSRADRLAGVFDHAYASLSPDLVQHSHVGTLAEEVDRDNGFGSRGQRSFNLLRVDIERVRLNVDEDRLGP
jgi:hypothetical protein